MGAHAKRMNTNRRSKFGSSLHRTIGSGRPVWQINSRGSNWEPASDWAETCIRTTRGPWEIEGRRFPPDL
jgi:hypothetical protein